LEAQFQADVELLRASYELRLQALETLFHSPGEGAFPAPLALKGRPILRLAATAGDSEPAAAAAPGESTAPPAAPDKPKLKRGQVMDDLAGIFERLPEEFDLQDVVRALGYKPPRATLYRALMELLTEGHVKMAHHSDGRTPTRYRKLPDAQ
jgi:hypothetical protein